MTTIDIVHGYILLTILFGSVPLILIYSFVQGIISITKTDDQRIKKKKIIMMMVAVISVAYFLMNVSLVFLGLAGGISIVVSGGVCLLGTIIPFIYFDSVRYY